MHVEYLIVEEKKMSKSLGNTYTIPDVVSKGFRPSAVRYLLLSAHYRKQLNFTWDSLAGAEKALQRLTDCLGRLGAIVRDGLHPELTARVAAATQAFAEAMADDLNTAAALGAIFELVSDLNSAIDAGVIGKGDVVVGALFQTGRFDHSDSIYVWRILAGSSVGLLASTLGRLYSSTYYAFRDTRTPLRYAVIRVALTTVMGYLFAIPLPRLLGLAHEWGAAGLTASAGIAGWVEMLLLRATLNARIGRTGLPAPYVAQLWGSAIAGAAVAWGVKIALPSMHPIVTAVLVLGPYGAAFFAMTLVLRIPEASTALARVVKR
jgi:peptidoglycan biosynthesis protein MviN/MurJ (putative lipid II flippase)